jgi:hypothetical protein
MSTPTPTPSFPDLSKPERARAGVIDHALVISGSLFAYYAMKLQNTIAQSTMRNHIPNFLTLDAIITMMAAHSGAERMERLAMRGAGIRRIDHREPAKFLGIQGCAARSMSP